MKNKKPIKLKAHPGCNHQKSNGNKSASAKKASRKNNRRRDGIEYSIFKVQDRASNRKYNVLLVLCGEGQFPWQQLNFGNKTDKESFRHNLTFMDIIE